MQKEAWHAVIHGVTKSQTGLSDETELMSHFAQEVPRETGAKAMPSIWTQLPTWLSEAHSHPTSPTVMGPLPLCPSPRVYNRVAIVRGCSQQRLAACLQLDERSQNAAICAGTTELTIHSYLAETSLQCM